MSKTTLTLPQKFEIMERLKEILMQSGENTVCYPDGETDATVAEKFSEAMGVPVTKHNVFSIRSESFGKLAPMPVAQNVGTALLLARIEALEARLEEMAKSLENLWAESLEAVTSTRKVVPLEPFEVPEVAND